MSFDNVRYGSVAQAASRNFARSADRAKNRTFGNAGKLQPLEQRLRRAICAAPGYGHNHSFSLLIGLGARYPHQKSFFGGFDIRNIQGNQLRATQRPSKAQQNNRAIPQAYQAY